MSPTFCNVTFRYAQELEFIIKDWGEVCAYFDECSEDEEFWVWICCITRSGHPSYVENSIRGTWPCANTPAQGRTPLFTPFQVTLLTFTVTCDRIYWYKNAFFRRAQQLSLETPFRLPRRGYGVRFIVSIRGIGCPWSRRLRPHGRTVFGCEQSRESFKHWPTQSPFVPQRIRAPAAALLHPSHFVCGVREIRVDLPFHIYAAPFTHLVRFLTMDPPTISAFFFCLVETPDRRYNRSV